MKASNPKTGVWAMVFLLLAIAAVIGVNIILLVGRISNSDRRLLYIISIGAALIALPAAVVLMKRLYDIRKSLLEERGRIAVAPPPRPPEKGETGNEQAVLLLSLLQEKGRFVDFVMEDVAPYSNEQVGAAARVVHQGCREVVEDCFDPRPVADRKENSEIVLEPEFDASEYRLTGKVSGGPPYKGLLVHKGWKAVRVRLPRPVSPKVSAEPVIVPAEVTMQ